MLFELENLIGIRLDGDILRIIPSRFFLLYFALTGYFIVGELSASKYKNHEWRSAGSRKW